jgi:hypothetical protein
LTPSYCGQVQYFIQGARRTDMAKFTASVQYGDWKGTVAADNADRSEMQNYLKTAGMIAGQEFLVGIELSGATGGAGGEHHPFIFAYVISGTSLADVESQLKTTGPIQVRRLDLKLSLQQFFDLFKRFHLTISPGRLDFHGREYEVLRPT